MKDYTYYNDVLQNEAKPTLFLELEAFWTKLKAISNGAIITVMTDNIEHLNRLEEIAKQTNGYFLVCILVSTVLH